MADLRFSLQMKGGAESCVRPVLPSEPATMRKKTTPEPSALITLAKEVVSATFAAESKKRTISPP